MRLAFFGTSEFAVPALRALADSVTLAVTQPDRPSGRGNRPNPSPVKRVALELGLTVETPEKARNTEFVARITELKADALLVASYGQILSEALLEAATRGGINLHASVLPRHRGASPIQSAILAGDSESGVSLMQMNKGMDTGDVIAIEKTPIAADETSGQLESRLALIAANMAVKWMPKVVGGEYPRTPQDPDLATLAPKLTKADAELSFEGRADDVFRRFRACTPRPGAWIGTRFGRLRVLECRAVGVDMAFPAGVALAVGSNRLDVSCSEGSLRLIRVQAEGKGAIQADDWANGRRISVGSSLT